MGKKIKIEKATIILQKLKEEKALLIKQKQDSESSFSSRSSLIKDNVCKLEEDVKLKSVALENLCAINEKMKVNLENLRLSNEEKTSANSKLVASIATIEKERDELTNLVSKKKIVLENVVVACEEEDKIEKDLEMIRADLRVCEENRKLMEREASSYENIDNQKVGLEKEKANRQNRLILLKEKEDNYVKTLSLINGQLAELQVEEDGTRDLLIKYEKEVEMLEYEITSAEKANATKLEGLTKAEAELRAKEKRINEIELSLEDLVKSKESKEG